MERETIKDRFDRFSIDVRDFRKLTTKKITAGAGCVFIAILIYVIDLFSPINIADAGIVFVAGTFGAIPGIIAVFLSNLVMMLFYGNHFAVSDACSTQLIVIITSYFVGKGALKTKKNTIILGIMLSFVECMGYFMGNLLEDLGEGIININWLLDAYGFTYIPSIIIGLGLIYISIIKSPDRYLLFLSNLHPYIRDEYVRECINEQEIRNRKHSLGGRFSVVIVIVATIMTISAIFLFNALYFKPEMLKANQHNKFREEMGREETLPSEAPTEPSDSVEIIVNGEQMSATEIIEHINDNMQLSGWDTTRGIAKNISFFIKFVMGLIYVEVAAIAIAISYVINTVSRPVEAIAFAMHRYAAGTEEERIESNKYIHGINIRTGDELENLYFSFEKMVDDFGEYVERLQKENELKRDLEVERASNTAKSAFLSNMSHELRTPINAVLGMDEMILRESEDDTINEYAVDIRNAGKTLLGLVNDILDFSKIEAGKMEIITVDYEMASVINDLVNMIRTRAADKGLELIVHVDESMPHLLHGDEIRLKQVITNILTNAVKYTEKGSITLNMDYEKVGEKELELSVSVKDTGIGIKEEDLNKLFVAFERIEEKRNRTIEGTGLGMNITQSLLNMMGSRLEVESVYGEGSNFHFKLRQGIIKDEPIGNIEETYKKTLEKQEKYKESFRAPNAEILVVDDTEMNLTVIKNLLKQTKIKVDTAASGFECLDKVKEKAYDIIFLDHRMPEMDGMETFKKLKEMPDTESKCKDTPVVALTANAISGAREEYLNAGFNDYLTKPVDSARLEKLIREYLPEDKVEVTDIGIVEERFGTEELPDWIKEIDGIDTAQGITNCGSAEDYMTAIGLFYDNIQDNYDNIKKFFDEKDRNNYNIKVHALKSSARLIGAGNLSELARSLEEASNEDSEDKDYVREKTPELLDMYRGFLNTLAPISEAEDEEEDDSGKPEIDADGLNDAYGSLSELIGVADYDSSNMILESLGQYRIADEKEKERYRDIKKAAKKFDWDKVLSLLSERAG